MFFTGIPLQTDKFKEVVP